MEIIPAILPDSAEDLAERLAQLAQVPGVNFVQVDAVDGKFASPASWPYKRGRVAQLPALSRYRYDADLMVADPAAEAERFVMLGASRITIHAESALDLGQFLKELRRRLGHEKDFAPDLLSIGLALSLETPLATIEPYIDEVDYVQLMGIKHIGKQRQPFEPRVLPRIEALHRKYPDLPIQIDGGVSLISAPLLVAAGATRLVVGSALFGAPNIAAEYLKFKALMR